MAKTNFESLRVYQLSEHLADQVWSIVLDWNVFARDTIGKQLVRSADSIGQTSPRERAVEPSLITDDSYEWRVAH